MFTFNDYQHAEPRSLLALNKADLLTRVATEALLEQGNQQPHLTVYGKKGDNPH